VDHLAGCQQLAVVVAAVDARDEAVDALPDVNGIVHDLWEIMTPYRRRSTRVAREMGAEKAGKRPGLEPGTPRFFSRESKPL
jgi:hypothetical protein